MQHCEGGAARVFDFPPPRRFKPSPPVKKKDGRTVREIYETLREAAGERGADVILDKATALYGGWQVYIPLERGAFEDEIAEGVYKRHMEEGARTIEMSRGYGFSFTKAYSLWKKGRKIKLRKEMKKCSSLQAFCKTC
jgi:Mor family transcriptional regulator